MEIDRVVRDHYFKVPHDGPPLMSGLPLPDPKYGPYRFVGCNFHPALREELEKNYKNCEFVDCHRG